MVPIPRFGYFNRVLVYNAWNNDFEIIRQGNFLELFQSQLAKENITLNDTIIFDCTNEGIGTDTMNGMVADIQNFYPNLEVKVLFNVVVNESLDYKFETFPTHMVAHCRFLSHVNNLKIDWKDLVIDRHFISLQRRISVSRLKFTRMLLDTFGTNSNLISCATQPNRWANDLPVYKNIMHPYTLPITVDGEIEDDRKQHFHTDERFFKCFFNIVSETSSQSDDDSWTQMFITEKTFKAFAYRQLPLWNAIPGTVQTVRDMGFDVFDDIVDHSYDNIINEDERRIQLLNEIKRICKKYTIDDLNILRKELWPRISNNMMLLSTYEREHPMTKNSLLIKLINK